MLEIGYVGGSVLAKFLDHPSFASFNITALIRSPAKAEKLRTLGVNTVVGSNSDLQLLRTLAQDADFVLAMADSDDLEATKAILDGLKQRYNRSGIAPVYIHTSGTGVITDDARGMHGSSIIYDDKDIDQIESLPLTQIHRNVDTTLVAADQEGYVKSYIILPGLVYGRVSTKLVDLGIQNSGTLLLKLFFNIALERGVNGMVGKGLNTWVGVDVSDLADLYVALYDSIKSNPETGHGREGYYFAENGEYLLYDVAKGVALALVEAGKSQSAEPTSFTEEELEKWLGATYVKVIGGNSRCIGNRSREIGWRPTKTTLDFLANIRSELNDYLTLTDVAVKSE